tara:strand:+ start:29894 stop:30013 length:120 start_codon:yes stop_codon:yes gene_type:complete
VPWLYNSTPKAVTAPIELIIFSKSDGAMEKSVLAQLGII